MSGKEYETTIMSGWPPITVLLRRSGRARRLSLRVSRLDGRVTLTIPKHAQRATALEFLREREDWLRSAVATTPPVIVVEPDTMLPVGGVPLRIKTALEASIRREGKTLLVPERRTELTGARVAAWLRIVAGRNLSDACARHAHALGRAHGPISLRDTRSRWGSCTCDGRLMFSWRLAMAPPEVLDYVAAHEVAHLAEMNHSIAYWRVVERLMPDYRTQRRWLRTHGSELHRYRFDRRNSQSVETNGVTTC